MASTSPRQTAMPPAMVSLLVLIAVVAPAAVQGQAIPSNFNDIECAFHQLAAQMAAVITPQAPPQVIADALHLQDCPSWRGLPDRTGRMRADRPVSASAGRTVYVSPTGNDANSGTSPSTPVQSLQRAQQLARALQPSASSPVAVLLASGIYYLNQTLVLDNRDSFTTYAGMAGAKPVLSSSIRIAASAFQPVPNMPGVLRADTGLPPDPPMARRHQPESTPSKKCGQNTTQPADDCALQTDTDFDGNDLATTTASSPVDCCNKCAAYAGCKFFTIEHAAGGTCWLKSSDAGRRPYADHVSGQPGGGPPPPPPPPPPPFSFGPSPPRVNSIFVNGQRMIRARYPNGNPQDLTGLCFSKTQYSNENCNSYLAAEGSFGGNLPAPGSSATVSYPINRGASPTYGCPQCTTYGLFHYDIFNPPTGHPVYNQPLPGVGWNNNSVFSFWGSPFDRPGGFVNKELAARAANWSQPDSGVVHMFHSGLWGGWQYQLNGFDAANQAFTFGYGGFQEARGSGISNNHFYVENILEELDSPGEWWFDRSNGSLYIMPNGTWNANSVISIPMLDTLVLINGSSMSAPATNVGLQGLTFTETRSTFFRQYEVPSGGDWSVFRGATVHVTNAASPVISNCNFNQTGGNGLILSNYVRGAQVANNTFVHVGDSAIVLLGSTNGIDGTQGNFPMNTTIANNLMHEIGVFGKQTSCIFQALAARSTVVGNVCFNGPRAGINFNDGFYGGHVFKGNLVFNMVRETGDHGPFNSWDRQPYLTRNGINDGFNDTHRPAGTSIIKARDYLTNNLVINGYNGVWTYDADDGSQFINHTQSVMLWGGCKNYLGNSKSCDHNLILFPGIPNRATGGRRCQTDDNGVFANQVYDHNTCLTADGQPYSWNSCSTPLSQHVFETFANTFYSPNATFSTSCGSDNYPSLQAWQQAGQDSGSAVQNMMSIDDMLSQAKALLQGYLE